MVAKSEYLGIIDATSGSVGAVVSLVGRNKGFPILKSQIADVVIGGFFAILGYFSNFEYVSDITESFGVGMIVGAVL